MAEADPGLLDGIVVRTGTGAGAWSRTERWPELKGLLAAALDLSADERDAFLRQHCDDPGLRSELDALLAFEGDTSVDLRREVSDCAGQAVLEDGGRIGPYRVERRIGRGGMGEVYLAFREQDFRQPVAIKVLRPGTLRAVDIERFHRERQLLADLDHPGIARLFDGGRSESGAPYMVMEWIDGEPLDRAADRRQLGIRRRVELFLQVCDAIAFAHRRLVIHRDLKPANVLLPKDGGPKLLDFGIARLLEPGGTARDTRPGPQPLTPRYASPEQWAGRPLTTSSDLFSAALVLAELLVGPLVVDSSTERAEDLQGLLRSRLRGEDLTPSELEAVADQRSTKPATLLSTVRGDLEAVLLRALAADPDDRYSGVESFADDLRRWQGGFPVHARRNGIPRRVLKLLRRRPWTSSLAALAMVTILSLSALSQWQSQRLVIEKAEAEERADEAWRARMRSEEMNQLIVDLFDLDQLEQKGLAAAEARKILDVGLERAVAQFAGDPSATARVQSLFASSYRGLGLLEDAHRLYEKSILDPTADMSSHERAKIYRDLGKTRIRLGQTGLAIEAFRQGELELLDDPWPRTRLFTELLGGWHCARSLQQDPTQIEGAEGSDVPPYGEFCGRIPLDGLRDLEPEIEADFARLETSPNEVLKVYTALFEMYFGRSDHRNARRIVEKSLALIEAAEGDDVQADPILLQRARIEIYGGQPQAALRSLAEAEERMKPPDVGILDYSVHRLDLRALATFQVGEEESAIGLLRAQADALRASGQNPEVVESLAALFLAGTGDCGAAASLTWSRQDADSDLTAQGLVYERTVLAQAYCALAAGDEGRAAELLEAHRSGIHWPRIPDSVPFLRKLKELAGVDPI